MAIITEGKKIIKVLPFAHEDKFLCPKGLKIADFIHAPDRLLNPMVRKGGVLIETTWDEALNIVAGRLSEISKKHGPDSIGFMGMSRCTNEEIYAFQKFARAVIGTNNIDNCARTCHIPSLKALMKSIGSATASNTMDQIMDTKVIFIAGYNPESHPRLYRKKIKAAKDKGSKLIVMDPRRTPIAEIADIFLQIKPGTNITVFNAMANGIIEEGLADLDFIQKRTEGYDELKNNLKKYTPEYAEEISGVPARLIVDAARLYATGGSSLVLWGMGLTQYKNGVNNVSALMNIVLLTGNAGKINSGFSPVRGQNNVQGGSFIGALPDVFPGYVSVTDDKARERFEALWNVDCLPKKSSLTSTAFIPNVLNGTTKALYISGENPAISQANLNIVRKALDEVEFLVVQDIFVTETAKYADVLFPACAFAEKGGTFLRYDRAVQRLDPAIDPPGNSLPDWRIFQMLASKMGHDHLFPYKNVEDIWEEMRKAIPDFAGITYKRLEKGQRIHFPCPDEGHPGTPIKYIEEFPRPGGRALFVSVEDTPLAEATDDEYPLYLMTGRDIHHYCTSTMTGHVPYFRSVSNKAYIDIHPDVAAEYKLSDGDDVEVSSRRGKVTLMIRITANVQPDFAFAPFNFTDSPINFITNDALDPVSKTPEYKMCAVKITKK
jgi:formate dehydrogenase alpha subunit